MIFASEAEESRLSRIHMSSSSLFCKNNAAYFLKTGCQKV